jgi:hypothetical protein
MGRSFESDRMGAKEVSARWLKASRALKKEDQICRQRRAEMVKKHSSEAFYAFPSSAFSKASAKSSSRKSPDILYRLLLIIPPATGANNLWILLFF